jgi:hypothetical protein
MSDLIKQALCEMEHDPVAVDAEYIAFCEALGINHGLDYTIEYRYDPLYPEMPSALATTLGY